MILLITLAFFAFAYTWGENFMEWPCRYDTFVDKFFI